MRWSWKDDLINKQGCKVRPKCLSLHHFSRFVINTKAIQYQWVLPLFQTHSLTLPLIREKILEQIDPLSKKGKNKLKNLQSCVYFYWLLKRSLNALQVEKWESALWLHFQSKGQTIPLCSWGKFVEQRSVLITKAGFWNKYANTYSRLSRALFVNPSLSFYSLSGLE